jgi:hypothetical protein
VTHQYAREAVFKCCSASLQISGVGTGNKNKSKVQYSRVLLRKTDGSLAKFTPYGVEKITGDVVWMDLEKAKVLFPSVAGKLESPSGPIHMLIGMDHMKNALREHRGEGVVLYQSEFNAGYVACGDLSQGDASKGQKSTMLKVLSCRSGLFNPPESIPAEAMGMELPRRCPACKNCEECQFRMDSLSFQENAEYEVILGKLRLDVNRKKWVAGYPFNTMVEHLIDNYKVPVQNVTAQNVTSQNVTPQNVTSNKTSPHKTSPVTKHHQSQNVTKKRHQ